MKQEKHIGELESMPIKKLLWRYFLPALSGVVVNALYNIVDRIFIGQGVDALALSGLSATFPLMLITFAFAMLIAMGSNVRISINLGKKEFSRAEQILGTAVVAITIISIILTIFGYIYRIPLLELFGAGQESISYANEYFSYIIFGTLFMGVGFVLNNAARAEGNAKTAMYSLFISAGTNIILDPIFIFGFNMGVKGAAIATIISQFVLCIWVFIHFTGQRSLIKLRLQHLRLNLTIVGTILAIGFAPFSMQLAASAVQAVLNTQLNYYGGDLAVGAMGIINSIAQLIVMSIIAINMASQPIVSFNYGANNGARVRETLKTAIVFASIISFIGYMIVMFFPTEIVYLFNRSNENLIQLGTQGLRLFFAVLPLIGFQIIVGNFYQAIGRAKIAALLSLLRQVIILIPVLLTLPQFWGLTGVWIASPISDTISAIITLVYTYKAFRITHQLAPK